jgi:hypothetical protein
VQRFHVETAFVWFVLLAIVSVALRRGTSREPEAAPTTFGRAPLTSLLVFWAAAVALYFPALSVGFLSDDFPLLERAARWQIGAVHAAFFRPLPMLVWSILEAAGAPAAAYHLLNVLLHGTNAFLSGLVVRGWVRRRWAGEVAALLVLLAPLAVEAVAWCSGLFDVSMTTFALATLLIFRGREDRKSSALLAAGIGTAAAAILCKETGVVIPALLVCDAVARRSRAYLRDAGFRVVVVMAAAYAAVRVWLAVGAMAPPVTKYVAQRTIFQAFGALADPWRADVASTAPVLPVISVPIVTGILVRFVLVARSRQSLRVPIATCLWILASVAPVGAILWIPGDLQASRYMYLAASAWAGLLCAVAWEATNGTRRTPAVLASALGALLVLSTYATRQEPAALDGGGGRPRRCPCRGASGPGDSAVPVDRCGRRAGRRARRLRVPEWHRGGALAGDWGHRRRACPIELLVQVGRRRGAFRRSRSTVTAGCLGADGRGQPEPLRPARELMC